MGLSARFTIRNEATPALLDLLTQTTLGTNGARYAHLDTRTRILEADNPLFLSVERDGKVQGNVTFCRRGKQWYVRYFAFSGQKQASKTTKHAERGNSLLKQEIARFYDDVFDGNYGDAPECFYAYIDPKNERSKWMSEQFGFHTEAHLATQTYSRVRPRKQANLRIVTDEATIHSILDKIALSHAYYTPTHAERPIFYGLYSANDELLAFTKITRANWIIERLPGVIGGLLTKLIPYIPRVRKLIKPKHHHFLVPESVWVKDNNPVFFNQLFEGILAEEKSNSLFWWVDRREALWRDIKGDVYWGLLHLLTVQTNVDVVVLRKNSLKWDELKSKPVFVAGWDMV